MSFRDMSVACRDINRFIRVNPKKEQPLSRLLIVRRASRGRDVMYSGSSEEREKAGPAAGGGHSLLWRLSRTPIMSRGLGGMSFEPFRDMSQHVATCREMSVIGVKSDFDTVLPNS